MTQETALKKMLSGKNIFLTGAAGTGKTFVLNKFITECESKGLHVLRTAPTGIASLNLSRSINTLNNSLSIGKTLHTAYNIPIPAYGKSEKDIILSKIPIETRLADVIIIDEISMCRNDVFEYFAMCINLIKKTLKKNPQIIVCGDFFQLPPVVPESEKKNLKKFGLDPSGFCFLTPAWNKFKFVFCELTKIYRQDNNDFILNLGKLRIGDISCISYFNNRVASDLPTDCTIICSTNAEANEINDKHMELIDGPRCAYGCTRTGRVAKEYTVDDTIFLKPGAKIMFTTNDVINQNYQNGTLGVVMECLDKTILVKIQNDNINQDEKIIEVYPYEWKSYKITISNGVTSKKEIGSYKQLPVRLAYAITMHKTQGQTYEKCVISPNSFAEGQLYVALSRVKGIDGVYLKDFILPEYIKTNKIVKEFYLNHKINIPDWIIEKKKMLKEKTLKKTPSKTKISRTKNKSKKNVSIKKNAAKTTSKSSQKISSKSTVKSFSKKRPTKRIVKTSTK